VIIFVRHKSWLWLSQENRFAAAIAIRDLLLWIIGNILRCSILYHWG
jgi:hypothetical protein